MSHTSQPPYCRHLNALHSHCEQVGICSRCLHINQALLQRAGQFCIQAPASSTAVSTPNASKQGTGYNSSLFAHLTRPEHCSKDERVGVSWRAPTACIS